jgi:nitroimidazol reductase NimA-like FMN-containing flavoprotein (pyridoxamine 5'-phosphate oxidase superfamily)
LATTQPHGPVLEELSRPECLRLLGNVPIGRISYTRQALPALEPVNFALHDGAIVIRTNAGGKLAAATRRAVVAFQADDLDPVLWSGWSVTVVGTCEEVTDAEDIARLDKLGLESWAPGTKGHFIRIVPGIVTGRRLRAFGTAST